MVIRWDYPVDHDDVDQTDQPVHFSVEACRLRSSEPWTVIKTDVTETVCQIDHLKFGETYSFRVTSHHQGAGHTSDPSPPSNPLVIPLQDVINNMQSMQGGGGMMGTSRRLSSTSNNSSSCDSSTTTGEAVTASLWQRDFERKYIELEELGRGRFSVVRKCQEILSGAEVAVKFINRRKQSREDTQKEYEVLSSINHPALIHSTGLFLTASSDAIVLNL